MQPSRRPGPRRTAGHNGCGHPESSRVTGYVPPRDGILLVSASLTEARHDLAVVHCARQVRDARLVHRVCGHDADLVQVDVLYLLNPVLPFPSMPQFLGGMTMRCGEPDTLPYVSAAATYINQSGGHAGGGAPHSWIYVAASIPDALGSAVRGRAFCVQRGPTPPSRRCGACIVAMDQSLISA